MTLSRIDRRVLVIDVGSSRVPHAAIVFGDGSVRHEHESPLLVTRSAGGVVEFDAVAMATQALSLAATAIAEVGSVDGVGITAQRASTIVWNRRSGEPIAPAIGWQDLRTTGMCLTLQTKGLRLSPNQSATKLAFLLQGQSALLQSDLCFGTVESFVVWSLSQGSLHVTDRTNAAVTGLMRPDASAWDEEVLRILGIDESLLPRLTPSSGICGVASALPGAPPIASLCGDQQASLVGQACLRPGAAKATFGTGAMLDCCLGEERPSFVRRGDAGTFPIVAWEDSTKLIWGIEAIMLSAGACVDWLCHGIKLLDSPAESDALAGSVPDSGGVTFIPALGGTGTPSWDFGTRATFLGISGATTRAEIVHAVLEGIAQSGADLVESVERDANVTIEELCVDGGMTNNTTFLTLVANAIQRPVAVSSITEATTHGAGYLAGIATGVWRSLEEATNTASPARRVEPTHGTDREKWKLLSSRALETVPALSAIKF